MKPPIRWRATPAATPWSCTVRRETNWSCLQLPFGSYTPGQPEARLRATVLVSSLADTDAGLPIQVGGGFRFGNDPLDNPTADPSIIESPLHSATVTPAVYR